MVKITRQSMLSYFRSYFYLKLNKHSRLCKNSLYVINFGLLQSDHIKRLLLWKKYFMQNKTKPLILLCRGFPLDTHTVCFINLGKLNLLINSLPWSKLVKQIVDLVWPWWSLLTYEQRGKSSKKPCLRCCQQFCLLVWKSFLKVYLLRIYELNNIRTPSLS